MHTLFRDVKFSFRNLRNNPSVTAVALLAVALGIGANTALFSILYAAFWKELPYKDAERLMMVWESQPSRDVKQNVVNPANYSDWREQNRVFEDMAAFMGFSANLSGGGTPEEIAIQYATPNLFDVLGVRPIRGRTFRKDDGVGDNRVVILSYGLWIRRYGADEKIVGRQIFLNGRKVTVVGVMPRDFQFFIKKVALMNKKPPQLWVAFPITQEFRTRQGRYLSTIARLKPGVSFQQAQANMFVLAKQLEKQYRDFNAGWSVNVMPLREQISGELRRPLWILAGAVTFVLLIACTNVANLMLSRAVSRTREMAIRAALGAGRWVIIRQVLTESMTLSLIGGAAGVLLAVWGTQALSMLGQRADIQLESIQLNVPMLAFALGISLLTGLLFGIVPAFTAARWNLQEDLKSGTRGTSGVHSGKTRSVLVVAQLMFALILLSGAGLLIQSFMRLTSIDPGFDAKQILTFRILLPSLKYREDAQRISFFQNALARFRSLPGVKSAGMINFLPFTGPAAGTNFYIEGRPVPPPEVDQITNVFVVDDGFFKTLHIPLFRGRMFSQAEMTQRRHVVLINEALARKYFPSEDPLGKKLTINMRDDNVPSEIIGIVGDAKQENLAEEIEPSVYWPHPELSYSFMTMVLRTDQDAYALMPQILTAMHQLDADQPVADVRVLEDWLGDSAARPKFNMVLLALLAFVALTLAVAGIYGVISYAVTQRTQEMGIRMALGATAADVLRLILKEGSRLILAGLLAGIAASLALTRLMKSMLFETSSTDPLTLVCVVILLMLAAFIACWMPSRRAAKVDPIEALRYE